MASVVCFGYGLSHRFLKAVSCNYLLQNCICSSTVNNSKHYNQKFRKLRSLKVIKVELPDYEESTKSFSDLTPEEARSRMKEKGLIPTKPHMERPLFLSTTGDIFEAYVPPEGDGKVSFITKEGAKQKIEFVGKKGKSLLAIRKLRKLDDDFELKDFLVLAQDIYVKAHKAMMRVREDKEELNLYVTERAYPEMMHNAIDKTIKWNMIGLLEEPRLVQARSFDVISKENIFSQLTVRFHTQQSLAVYDRFGRLMYGSEILAKDVLEYVVYEKHMSNKYGSWRIHAKIIPDWLPPKDAVPKTYRIVEDSSEEPPSSSSVVSEPQNLQLPPGETPAIATA